MTWKNWAGNVVARPVAVRTPGSDETIRRVVMAAADAGEPVKVVGSGHSFSAVAAADGVQITPEGMAGIRGIDPDTGEVTLGAGTRLHRIAGLLEPHRLALQNMGDIDRQTIAGAVSTGTHGTGWAFTGFAARVTRLRMVLASGDVVTCDEENDTDLFQAARLGLGALGVITEVTMACVPAFDLAAQEGPEPLPDVLADFEERASAVDHFEFYWFPHTTTALVKQNRRVGAGEGRRPVPRSARLIDDELVNNGVFRVTCAVGRRVPALVPWVNEAATRLVSARDYSDRSDRVFVSPRRVRFTEMEYAVPVDALPSVFAEVRKAITTHDWRISFPVEVRVAAPDDVWLSTAHGRRTAYLAVHRYRGEDPTAYFDAVEAICRAAGGRPHWGKMHSLGHRELSELYPRFEDFRRVRAEVDPHGRFTNAYLDRVLGPAGG